VNKTEIPWADASWNPVTGCSPVSPGCDHCYARRFAERWRGQPGHPYEQGFDLKPHPKRLGQPASWKKPARIFVCSMSDLFQGAVTTAYLDRVFEAMEAADWHIFQVLTKRAARMCAYLKGRWARREPPGHIWVGVTAEDQIRANQRITQLRLTPARIRFVSAEPLIGPIQFTGASGLTPLAGDEGGISQVIVGGESGPGFRPMQIGWAHQARVACRAAGAAFFFKQHAGVRPRELGHLLDGVEYREYPA